MLLQVISVFGALAILGAYAANLLGWLGPANLSYSVANLIGSGLLTFIAIVDQRARIAAAYPPAVGSGSCILLR
jgi:hypothetical protein